MIYLSKCFMNWIKQKMNLKSNFDFLWQNIFYSNDFWTWKKQIWSQCLFRHVVMLTFGRRGDVFSPHFDSFLPGPNHIKIILSQKVRFDKKYITSCG